LSFLYPVLALLALPLGFWAGKAIRGAFSWSWATVSVLMLVTLLPWFVHHGQVLNALRFGAVQSEWTYPTAFSTVHGVGYLVAGLAAIAAVAFSGRRRWALVFGPGLAFLGTLLITLPSAVGAVPEGYFLLSEAATSRFWVGTMAMTAMLLGYCWSPTAFAPDSVAPAGSPGEL